MAGDIHNDIWRGTSIASAAEEGARTSSVGGRRRQSDGVSIELRARVSFVASDLVPASAVTTP